MRIALAVNNEKGLDDTIAERFGRAPKLLIVDVENNEVKIVKVIDNPGAKAPSGAAVKAIQALVNEGVEIVVGPSFGPNAQAILAEVGIKPVTVPAGTSVRKALEEALKHHKESQRQSS